MTTSTILTELYNIRDNGENIDILIDKLKYELTREVARKNGTTPIFKACADIIKFAVKNTPTHSEIHGAWIDANGRECVTDSYRVVRLTQPVNLSQTATGIDLDKIIKPDNYTNIIDIPELDELTAFVKIEKARKRAEKDKTPILYDFGENKPHVNAEYLMTMMQALPGAVVKLDPRQKTLSFLYFTSNIGDGVLLPLRKKAKGI